MRTLGGFESMMGEIEEIEDNEETEDTEQGEASSELIEDEEEVSVGVPGGEKLKALSTEEEEELESDRFRWLLGEEVGSGRRVAGAGFMRREGEGTAFWQGITNVNTDPLSTSDLSEIDPCINFASFLQI